MAASSKITPKKHSQALLRYMKSGTKATLIFKKVRESKNLSEIEKNKEIDNAIKILEDARVEYDLIDKAYKEQEK